ncbi:hypothetical protein SAMN04487995_4382 [Dyadobacter koreensis]|uniref:DUF4595 domain-containing protein n=1 Tax=Dyadobacter koreensis TaxID=408657 RepID=A0A1H6YAU5_9BACT|nr:hypothetical protein [Dyadobacter koreensis]SEJ38408.1 hypothetical protein SAMN04487995_4382 [Dyadobacter koreensis]
MKNFFYLAVLLAAISCNSNANEPDPVVAIKHQSPFGTDTIGTKLKSVTFNGKLLIEYSYSQGYLSGYKKYVAFSKPRFFQTGIFTRIGGEPQKAEVLVAQITPETEFVSEKQDPRMTLQYAAPKTDSIREVAEQDFLMPSTTNKIYKFNKDGFIVEEVASPSSGDAYSIIFVRNGENNVSQTYKVLKSQSAKTDKVEFIYDTKPNPFFNLGIDWEGNFTNYAVSPNNPLQEIIYNKDNVGVKSTYAYEYLPNGYPKKITITRGFINVDGVEETDSPIVLDLLYY